MSAAKQCEEISTAELSELATSIDYLSGPDAWDENLEERLIPVVCHVPRLIDEFAIADHRAKTAERALRAVYRERAHLVALLAALYPSTWKYGDPDAAEWPIVYIDFPTGQASWHISPSDWWLFKSVPAACDTEWDGHDTDEKYWRIRSLTFAESGA